MCSGVLIVREAGGLVTQPNGNEWKISSKDILASNSNIHSILTKKLTLQ